MNTPIKWTIEYINANKPIDSKLTVISFDGFKVLQNGIARAKVICKCDCGKIVNSLSIYILHGKRKSCGCNRGVLNIKHGLSARKNLHPIYILWANIKMRCNNPNHPFHHRYGGRGVCFYPEWNDNFVTFKDWCLKNGWEAGLELDRKDNDGNYTPENCRFITSLMNKRNRGYLFRIAYKGENLLLTEWSEKLGIKYKTLVYRFLKKWPTEKILSTVNYNYKRQ